VESKTRLTVSRTVTDETLTCEQWLNIPSKVDIVRASANGVEGQARDKQDNPILHAEPVDH